jgi:hypothetical protein
LCALLWGGAWAAPAGAWPPEGRAVRLPVNRDVWISSVSHERDGNNGGGPRLRIKGNQDLVLLDADCSGLRGRIITGALLHVHSAAPDAPLVRTTVSTVAAPWVEGTSTGYRPQAGSACFRQAALGERNWAGPDSTVMDVAFGRGHTLWRFADASPPDADGWQRVAVDPDVLTARVAGLSHGFGVYDDVGSVWSYTGGEFKFQFMLNRYFHGRESGRFAPFLEVWTAGRDDRPPGPVERVTVRTAGLPAGEAVIEWTTPPDGGGGRTLGFHVSCEGPGRKGPLPRYRIPMAGRAGETVRMHLHGVGAGPGERLRLRIAAVDSAGNIGPDRTHTVTLSAAPQSFPIAADPVRPFAPRGRRPIVGGLKVAVVDLLDKIHPATGQMILPQPAGYKRGNHLWSAAEKRVRLQAARNEAVCFQVNLEGAAQRAELKLDFPEAGTLKTRVFRFDYVGTEAGPMPDALVEQAGAFRVPFAGDPQAVGAKNCSLLCEVYVPHRTPPGAKRGTLTIAADGRSLKLAVDLTVRAFTLPDKLSFIPEMNCYNTAGPTGVGLQYYRVAHEHRLCLNRLYHRWSGLVDFAPERRGGRIDWSRWRRRFGPLLDGSAFADLPRAGEPVDVFYLPFNENWPADIYRAFRKSYWPEEALSASYRRQLGEAMGQFARLADRSGWHETIFQFMLNCKVYFKQKVGWRGASAPWRFDEPSCTQDFWALRWYGRLFHEAVDPVRGKAKMWFRADVSMPQYGRNILRGVADVTYIGGATRQKMRMKRDDRVLWGLEYHPVYGGANHPKDPNVLPVTWCLKAWGDGCVGVLPWQTIAKDDAWNTGESTGLFYRRDGRVFPSVRLKAFRRGQQDVEYLTLLGATYEQPAFAVADGVRRVVNVNAPPRGPAPWRPLARRYGWADPGSLWALRQRVGRMISARRPPYRRCVRPMPTPPRTGRRMPDIGYVRVAPDVPSAKPQ